MSFDAILEAWIKREGIRNLHEHFGHSIMDRGGYAWTAFAASEEVALPDGHLPSEGLAMALGHAMGQVNALNRASMALSDPRARGVEREVVEHLAAGLDIEAALRKANEKQKDETNNGNIVIFRPNST